MSSQLLRQSGEQKRQNKKTSFELVISDTSNNPARNNPYSPKKLLNRIDR
ncbi:MAG: hypothetical protein LBI18_05600 [Planctomycetaceae bacterium]|nr:hypothetical protein [Planctomycetaceae bacterium]